MAGSFSHLRPNPNAYGGVDTSLIENMGDAIEAMVGMMKVLVCGGRDYPDKLHVWSVLHEIHSETPISHIIQGGAFGADAHAYNWARTTNGVQNVVCEANWERYGPRAGPIRNAAMLLLAPDLVLAFPGGKGTANMVMQARAGGVEVRSFAKPGEKHGP